MRVLLATSVFLLPFTGHAASGQLDGVSGGATVNFGPTSHGGVDENEDDAVAAPADAASLLGGSPPAGERVASIAGETRPADTADGDPTIPSAAAPGTATHQGERPQPVEDGTSIAEERRRTATSDGDPTIPSDATGGATIAESPDPAGDHLQDTGSIDAVESSVASRADHSGGSANTHTDVEELSDTSMGVAPAEDGKAGAPNPNHHVTAASDDDETHIEAPAARPGSDWGLSTPSMRRAGRFIHSANALMMRTKPSWPTGINPQPVPIGGFIDKEDMEESDDTSARDSVAGTDEHQMETSPVKPLGMDVMDVAATQSIIYREQEFAAQLSVFREQLYAVATVATGAAATVQLLAAFASLQLRAAEHLVVIAENKASVAAMINAALAATGTAVGCVAGECET